MSLARRAALALALAWPATARADDPPAPEPVLAVRARDTSGPPDALDLRLTLSTFFFRQLGSDAAPLVDGGAPIANASPVRRYFTDLRTELADDGLAVDARIRQTTSQVYQSGADGGGEYELRTLSYRLGTGDTQVRVGRQSIDAVGATRIDGVALGQRFTPVWSSTIFAGAYPQLGSRSLDTDYPAVRNADGTSGAPLVPATGGAALSYRTPDFHGDLGAAAIRVVQQVAGASSKDLTRVFTTSNGYWRPAPWLDVYHYGILDVAGANGVQVTNASLGVDAHPTSPLQLTLAANHVSTDLLAIAARNLLADPDPTAIGIVQNDLALTRVSSDAARAGASLAMARGRFELSLSGGFHRRPAIAVALPDGSGSVTFPEARAADATLTVLDRHSIADLRLALSGSIVAPVGDAVPNRARGAIVRLAASRALFDQRGSLEADVMVERFRDLGSGNGGAGCAMSMDVFACYGASTTSAAQGGALLSVRAAREWLFLVDAHVGVSEVSSVTIMQAVDYPRVVSFTTFARVQWTYR